jgi:hypothetical protein
MYCNRRWRCTNPIFTTRGRENYRSFPRCRQSFFSIYSWITLLSLTVSLLAITILLFTFTILTDAHSFSLTIIYTFSTSRQVPSIYTIYRWSLRFSCVSVDRCSRLLGSTSMVLTFTYNITTIHERGALVDFLSNSCRMVQFPLYPALVSFLLSGRLVTESWLIDLIENDCLTTMFDGD